MPTLRSLRYRRVINQKPVGNNPLALFRNGQDGFWLDPSDLSSLWVDEERTQHPTAPGDVVWWVDDKSGNDNHFGAVSSAARGRLYRWPASAVLAGYPRNELKLTEQLNSWGFVGSEVSVTSGIDDPAGGSTAFRIESINNIGRLQISSMNLAGATEYKVKAWARSVAGATNLFVYLADGTSNNTSLTPEWTEIEWTVTSSASTNLNIFQFRIGTPGKVIDIWHPQVATSDNTGTYQRVGSGIWDVTEEGQPDCWGIGADGVTTQYLSTRGIPLFVDGKMRVVAGVTKLADSVVATLLSNETSSGSNNSVVVFAPSGATQYRARYRSTANADANFSNAEFNSPDSSIIDAEVDSLSASSKITVNSEAPVASSTVAPGTISDAGWRIGSRVGTSFFNGIIWGAVVVAEEPDPDTWEQSARQWLSRKMGGILSDFLSSEDGSVLLSQDDKLLTGE